jgi:hypothetical protein
MDQQMKSNVSVIRFDGQEYRCWIQLVTPETAASYLEEAEADGTDPNRRKRRGRIARYASDIRRGDWKFTGEPIRLDKSGRLLNGQHRMMAIVEANMATVLMFVSGISGDTKAHQDTGLPASDDDWALISPAASKLVKSMLRTFNPSILTSASRTDLLETYKIIGAEHVEWAVASCNASQISRKSPVRAAVALMHKINPERAAKFAARINATDLPGGSPESRLFKSLMDNKHGNKRIDKECSLSMRAALWALRGGEDVTKLYSVSDKDLDWLRKAASIEPILSIRPPRVAK